MHVQYKPSLSFHQRVTCPRHDIAENMLTWRSTTMNNSLYVWNRLLFMKLSTHIEGCFKNQCIFRYLDTFSMQCCHVIRIVLLLLIILTWRPSFALKTNERFIDGIISFAHAPVNVTDFPLVA